MRGEEQPQKERGEEKHPITRRERREKRFEGIRGFGWSPSHVKVPHVQFYKMVTVSFIVCFDVCNQLGTESQEALVTC